MNPNTLARYDSGQYQPPTCDELRALLKDQGWTGRRAGMIAGVDDRTVRRWTSGQYQIPYAAWRLLASEAGLISQHQNDD